MSMQKRPTLKELADHLEDNARSAMDTEAAHALRKYSTLFKVAHEMVMAKTHEHSKAAYCEMMDLIKGKPNE